MAGSGCGTVGVRRRDVGAGVPIGVEPTWTMTAGAAVRAEVDAEGVVGGAVGDARLCYVGVGVLEVVPG